MDDLRPGIDAPVYKKFKNGSLSVVNEADEDLAYSFNNDTRKPSPAFTINYTTRFLFRLSFCKQGSSGRYYCGCILQIMGHAEKFAQLQNIKVFLQVSVRNACLSYLEHAEVVERHRKIILLSSDKETEDFFYEDQVKAQYLQRIFSAIEKLPVGQKKIFKLSYIDGLKEQEIADKLQLGKSTVHTQRMRALRTLRIAVLPLNWLFPFFFLSAFCNIY